MNIIYKREIPDVDNLMNLYTDVGWGVYLESPEKLLESLENSQDVISAWDDKKLVGLVRTIGDKTTILYIQDLLVLHDYKRNKIATTLVQMLLTDYADMRIILLADNYDEPRKFYESLGFSSSNSINTTCYIKLQG